MVGSRSFAEFPEPVHIDREPFTKGHARRQAVCIEFPIIPTDRMILRGITDGGIARIADPCAVAALMSVDGDRRAVGCDQGFT